MPEVFKFRKGELSKDLGIRDFDIMSRVYPQYVLFSKKYGNKVFYNLGLNLIIMVTSPSLVKEILLDVGNYHKARPSTFVLSALVGKSLLTMNGEEWANHRQVFAPAFCVEVLKGLVNKITTKSITSRLDIWEEKVQDGGGLMELEVHHEICIITMQAISHMLFSNIDQKTQQVFIQLKTLFETMSQATTNPFFTIPGYRFAKDVSKACQDPQGFIPFSFGPRYCIGQNLAVLQSKLIVAKVLSRFQLSVSPNYIHNPQHLTILTPKFGVQLHVKKLPPSISS
ncbi:unnamed protein product [Sphagnum balticum]